MGFLPTCCVLLSWDFVVFIFKIIVASRDAMIVVMYIPYSGNVWQKESLANLVNEHNLAKLKPSKRHMHIT